MIPGTPGARPPSERRRRASRSCSPSAPPRGDGWSRAFLKARFEFRGDETVTLPMPWTGLEGDRDLFSCSLDTTGYLGLVWYSFRLERLDGRVLELPERQLTVYDGAVTVPAWFGEGE